jgi:hypothetical protein
MNQDPASDFHKFAVKIKITMARLDYQAAKEVKLSEVGFEVLRSFFHISVSVKFLLHKFSAHLDMSDNDF